MTFIDAHQSVRCEAQIQLKDKSYAQCGRRQSQQFCTVCTQHRKMYREGKLLIKFVTNSPMTSIIDRLKRLS